MAPGASAQSLLQGSPLLSQQARALGRRHGVCTKPQSFTPNLNWSPADSHTQGRNIRQIIFTVPDEFRCLFLNSA